MMMTPMALPNTAADQPRLLLSGGAHLCTLGNIGPHVRVRVNVYACQCRKEVGMQTLLSC